MKANKTIEEVIEEVEEDEVLINEDTESGEEVEEGGELTGAVTGKRKITAKTIYYSVGGVFVLGFLIFLIFAAKKKFKAKKGKAYLDFDVKPEVNEEKKEELKDKVKDRNEELADAKKKLKEAEEDLDDVIDRGQN
jgi:hypothetical protein